MLENWINGNCSVSTRIKLALYDLSQAPAHKTSSPNPACASSFTCRAENPTNMNMTKTSLQIPQTNESQGPMASPHSISTESHGPCNSSCSFIGNGQGKKKQVSFGKLLILEFPLVLGNHPGVSSGAPTQLDWKYQSKYEFGIEVYESTRPKRRFKRELALSVPERARLYVSGVAKILLLSWKIVRPMSLSIFRRHGMFLSLLSFHLLYRPGYFRQGTPLTKLQLLHWRYRIQRQNELPH